MFDVKVERNKQRLKKTEKASFRTKNEGSFEYGRCALLIKVDCWSELY